MAISKTQLFFEKLWYRPTPIWLWLFLPLQLLLLCVVYIRRAFYRMGWFTSYKISAPVIVIGNISVGGTGKSPFAIYLLKLLKQHGFTPGLVTRGYGGSSENYPILMDAQQSDSFETSETGDEPLMIFQRTQATIAVDPVRSRGAKALVEKSCDVIICDDGLQHYALQRDLEIAISESKRGVTSSLGNGWLMPMGPLREPKNRLQECDFQVFNGSDMQLQAMGIQAVAPDNDKQWSESWSENANESVFAVAAIGNPQRFFNTLHDLDVEHQAKPFPDHHHFALADFDAMQGIIIMTEKDAVKCREFADERFYYLPVEATLKAELEHKLLTAIQALT